MPYHPQIPAASDDPSDSQSQILDNFGSLNTQFGINHTVLTASSNIGMHTKLFFPTGLALTADPNLTSPRSSLYPKLLTSGLVELFFQNGALPTNVKQLTNPPVVNGIITNVTYVGTTVTITSANHGLTTADTVTIDGVYGVTGLNSVTPYAIISVVAGVSFNVTAATPGGVYVANTGYWTSPKWSTVGTPPTRFGMRTPWGLIINWGKSNANPQTFAIPYSSSPPNILTAQITPSVLMAAAVIGAVTQTQFVNPAASVPYYLVIGT